MLDTKEMMLIIPHHHLSYEKNGKNVDLYYEFFPQTCFPSQQVKAINEACSFHQQEAPCYTSSPQAKPLYFSFSLPCLTRHCQEVTLYACLLSRGVKFN